MNYDDNDLEIMGKTIWGEARGEAQEGQAAVAWVILNRAQRSAYAGSLAGKEGAIAQVCLAKLQFSCWNSNDPNSAKLKVLSQDDYAAQHDIADDVLDGNIADPTDGADCYFGDYIKPPSWAASMRFTKKIGKHLFYDSRIPMPVMHTLYEGCALVSEVKRLQGMLNIVQDGIFGPDTKNAVMAYQHGHSLTVDGIAGPETLESLRMF